ncbi:PD-(D/E)XK nuclease family protein [Flavobacterium filum]|uniref:PD-(D/E)XK nuclease family protein n=1 Tax=Flavobacterium TaxID=237 RepID=UPI0023F030D9|nr:PD-(D/E)XK nuclease family protein [Flavobacterium filum]
MKPNSFIAQVASYILEHHLGSTEELTVVLPNKRAKVFLLEAIKQNTEQPIFAPNIVSVEEFVQDLAGIRSIDTIALLFEFYEVYLSLTPEQEQQTFELFSNWAKTLLQDFNEIDRYLIEPNHVFSYLKEIEAIKRWNLEPNSKTTLVDNYLLFWDKMPIYYDAFYKYLLKKGVGYQGLIYREAVDNLHHFTNSFSGFLLFAGFNALNQAEEKIIQHLLAENKAKVFWDTDVTFLNDPFHDAGLFARKIKKNWSYYHSHPYEWLVDEFSKTKNINVIGTPKTVGQAKLAGHIIENISKEQPIDKIALVLGDENVLIPALNALPASVRHLNITMGYSAVNNPIQLLISRLFKMHLNAFQRSESNYVFYYKDVIEVLQNPYVEPFANAKSVADKINRNNISFIPYTKLMTLKEQSNPYFELLFQKWDVSPAIILDRITDILLTIKQLLSETEEYNSIANAFVYAVFKVINKLKSYCQNHSTVTTIEGLYAIYKEVIDLAEVSFEGEPLQGLQIMGVLESRVLDFDTVIITSMNEGVFPAGKTQNSYIPFDVKRELGLPTHKEKDAIYTYHFYHLLLRANTIYLLYNTESDGLDGGEKSRFITQLEVEKQSNHILTHEIFNAFLPEKAHQEMQIEKSPLVMKRLSEMAENGFSPSTLTTYIRNPIQFYFQRILRISEVDEVEENIAVNTLGTIIHGALEQLYRPYCNMLLHHAAIDEMLQRLNDEVEVQFKKEYKEGEISKGKNLLAFEVAKRNIYNFLQLEKKCLDDGDEVEVLFLEQNFEQLLVDERLPFPVKIKGNVDRIERRNGMLRIIDYKTGKVEQQGVSISFWDGLTQEIKHDKIIQLLCYAFMVQSVFPNEEMEVGILSFKNLKSGFMPFQIKIGKDVIANTIDSTILDEFITEIIQLLNEILNVELSFEEKIL